LLRKLQDQLQMIRIPDALDEVNRLLFVVKREYPFACTYNELHARLRTIRESVERDLSKRLFMYVPVEKASSVERDDLFGVEVQKAFPSAVEDIKTAGTCYANDLNTACVFHLMRAAERGMRILALDRRVKFKNDAPLEMQGWEDILKGIETEVSKIGGWPNRLGLAKTQAQEFYNSAMGEFRGFKDAWRNHVMHTRRSYNAEDAKSILGHVCRFMQTLATRLSESTRTPKKWTKRQIIHGLQTVPIKELQAGAVPQTADKIMTSLSDANADQNEKGNNE